MGGENGDKTYGLSPVIYKLAGKPTPLARPRFTKRSIYDPQKEIKEECQVSLLIQNKKRPMLVGPLELNVTFFMQIPRTTSKKNKLALVRTPHQIKPDLSNLVKFIEDVAAGILYKDDKSIVSITARKLYDEAPRTIFSLRPIYAESDKKNKEKNP